MCPVREYSVLVILYIDIGQLVVFSSLSWKLKEIHEKACHVNMAENLQKRCFWRFLSYTLSVFWQKSSYSLWLYTPLFVTMYLLGRALQYKPVLWITVVSTVETVLIANNSTRCNRSLSLSLFFFFLKKRVFSVCFLCSSFTEPRLKMPQRRSTTQEWRKRTGPGCRLMQPRINTGRVI